MGYLGFLDPKSHPKNICMPCCNSKLQKISINDDSKKNN